LIRIRQFLRPFSARPFETFYIRFWNYVDGVEAMTT